MGNQCGGKPSGTHCGHMPCAADDTDEAPLGADGFGKLGLALKRQDPECEEHVDTPTDSSEKQGDFHTMLRRAISSERTHDVDDADEEQDACCLYWSLSLDEQAHPSHDRIMRLQEEIQSCINLFQAEVLMNETACGLIRGRPIPEEGMTAADASVRIGQLLCRWAASEDPPVGLYVGVHVGALERIGLKSSGGRPGFFGEAVYEARALTEKHQRERMVIMTKAAQNDLFLLRQLPLVISPKRDAFFLDPSMELLVEGTGAEKMRSGVSDGLRKSCQVRRTRLLQRRPTDGLPDQDASPPTFEEFVARLEQHNVDVSQFGQNDAMTLDDLYRVVLEGSCHLEIVNMVDEPSRIERVREIVRISLRVRDPEGNERELRRIVSCFDEGQPRRSIVGWVASAATQALTAEAEPDNGSWEDAIQSCFETRFRLSREVQKAYLSHVLGSHNYREERSSSDDLPGIMTTLKLHTVSIEVDANVPQLSILGLPKCRDFVTGSGPEPTATWTWALTHRKEDDELHDLLLANSVDVNDFSPNAFAELFDELYVNKQSNLTYMDGELVRRIRVVKVNLYAVMLGLEHQLVIKAKYHRGTTDIFNEGKPVSMRMSPGQDWREAARAALELRTGLKESTQREHVYIDTFSHKVTEEIGTSRTYPGLRSIYEINEVRAWVIDPDDNRLHIIGLPGGTDFSFARRERNSRVKGDGDLVRTVWTWTMTAGQGQVKPPTRPSFCNKKQERARRITLVDTERAAQSRRSKRVNPDMWKRRAPILEVDYEVSGKLSKPSVASASLSKLAAMMAGRETKWELAKRAAARITDPAYSCKDFYEDVTAAFPELRLYCPADDCPASPTTAGRSADDEYQRTIGALLALFWLMRLDCGGRESFCFGVDDEWQPRPVSEMRDPADDDADGTDPFAESRQKKLKFYESTNWSAMRELLVHAGLLKPNGGGHDKDRTMAMLVLLAIHDIMKLAVLQPTVDKGTFAGFKCGEVITDHDIALSFVLTRFPTVLPSFAGLSKAQKDSIRFTHCKLEYNMGWLVQAEAPPGALLRTFKKVVSSGKVPACNIAFYFVHWLTDLAGAEPFPLEGCEKFTLKFPQAILARFIESFSFIQSLSTSMTETAIVENYLVSRWPRELGAPPLGPQSIAKIRLVCMAQGDSEDVINAFQMLDANDRYILGSEMALTGCKAQNYSRDPLEGEDHFRKGPAILVYYAPALMQKAGRRDPRAAMHVLAELFRKARVLWPMTAKDVDRTITVRIDALKELDINAIFNPEQDMQFVIAKTSGVEATVQLKDVTEFQDLDWTKHQILCFRSMRHSAVFSAGSANSVRPSHVGRPSRRSIDKGAMRAGESLR